MLFLIDIDDFQITRIKINNFINLPLLKKKYVKCQSVIILKIKSKGKEKKNLKLDTSPPILCFLSLIIIKFDPYFMYLPIS